MSDIQGAHVERPTPPPPTDPGAQSLPTAQLRDGVAPLVADEDAARSAAASLSAGSGPIAVDAERASAYRYGQRAYLAQVRRQGSTTWLIDPIDLPGPALADLAAALHTEWVLHSALQDLPCLAELGWRPTAVFDTEVAARLLGRERVGLAALAESELGVHLPKGFGAADWSARPLPEEWLRYAALDVELLLGLRELLEAELRERGRWGWAEQEFAAILHAPGPTPRAEPWRRTSGMHQVRGRRGLAIVRSLWLARDEVARAVDVSPGRVLPDTTIVDLARRPPASVSELGGRSGMRARHARTNASTWWGAIAEAQGLPEEQLPLVHPPSDALPHPKQWSTRNPEGAERLEAYRHVVAGLAAELGIAVEVVMPPEALRRAAWVGGDPEPTLREYRARPWQIELFLPALEQPPPRSPAD